MHQLLPQRFTRLFAASMVGILTGISTTLFLVLLDVATQWRLGHPYSVIGLPVAGLAIGWMFYRYGHTISGGTSLILDEFHNPKKVISVVMVPFVFIGTVMTHLFGGSAGREGTAVQMGAALADQLSDWKADAGIARRKLLMAGAGAGFSAAVGTPIAGVLFGIEMMWRGRWRQTAWLECIIASFVAYWTTIVFHAPHSHFVRHAIPYPTVSVLVWLSIAAVCFGLVARVFVFIVHAMAHQFQSKIPFPPLRPFIGGILVLALFYWMGSLRHAGLGIEVIQSALQTPVQWMDPLAKIGVTALTVASGFKGGEFIPLVFIGATLGSMLSTVLPVSLPILSATGFGAVFGAAAKTPIATSVMICELFGVRMAPYALVACGIAYIISGSEGIYRGQK